jgi:hypothetical protein
MNQWCLFALTQKNEYHPQFCSITASSRGSVCPYSMQSPSVHPNLPDCETTLSSSTITSAQGPPSLAPRYEQRAKDATLRIKSPSCRPSHPPLDHCPPFHPTSCCAFFLLHVKVHIPLDLTCGPPEPLYRVCIDPLRARNKLVDTIHKILASLW